MWLSILGIFIGFRLLFKNLERKSLNDILLVAIPMIFLFGDIVLSILVWLGKIKPF